MNSKRLSTIILFNIFGFLLFFSWYIPQNHGLWFNLDSAVFYYFNQQIEPGSLFVKIIAFTNIRAFDAVSLAAMGLLYLSFYLKQNKAGRKRMLIMGVVMLLTGLVLNQLGHLIPVHRPSATLTFDNAKRVSHFVDFNTKDSSNDSFPGDHGLMLMVFAAFILRYYTRKAFAIAAVFVIIFTLPRIASGAHWFTDVYVGSLSLACVGLSWFLLTPASDWIINKLNNKFTR